MLWNRDIKRPQSQPRRWRRRTCIECAVKHVQREAFPARYGVVLCVPHQAEIVLEDAQDKRERG